MVPSHDPWVRPHVGSVPASLIFSSRVLRPSPPFLAARYVGFRAVLPDAGHGSRAAAHYWHEYGFRSVASGRLLPGKPEETDYPKQKRCSYWLASFRSMPDSSRERLKAMKVWPSFASLLPMSKTTRLRVLPWLLWCVTLNARSLRGSETCIHEPLASRYTPKPVIRPEPPRGR